MNTQGMVPVLLLLLLLLQLLLLSLAVVAALSFLGWRREALVLLSAEMQSGFRTSAAPEATFGLG